MKTTNVGEVLAAFNRLNPKLQTIVKQEMQVAVRNAEFEAKQNAPVDLGKHRQSITGEVLNDGLSGALTANMPYSPYLEFGTGASVDIPEGFESLAAQFKGKGIRQINLPARPHIIPAAKNAHKDLVKRLESRLSEL